MRYTVCYYVIILFLKSSAQIRVPVCVCLSVSTDSSRVKRMCVAERRQPYSGADWCSGGESDEDDKGFFSKCLN